MRSLSGGLPHTIFHAKTKPFLCCSELLWWRPWRGPCPFHHSAVASPPTVYLGQFIGTKATLTAGISRIYQGWCCQYLPTSWVADSFPVHEGLAARRPIFVLVLPDEFSRNIPKLCPLPLLIEFWILRCKFQDIGHWPLNLLFLKRGKRFAFSLI